MMKTIKIYLNTKINVKLKTIFFLSFILLSGIINAQLTGDTQSKINQTISETTSQAPLMGQIISKFSLGEATVVKDDGSTFKFKKVRSDILLTDVLKELSTVVGNPNINSMLANPVVKGIENIFKNTTLTANYTVENIGTNPIYSVSLVGEALDLNFEIYFGSGEWQKDFVLAIVPDKVDYKKIHESLATLNELGDFRAGVFLSQISSNNTPRMELLTDMGLEGYLLSSGLTLISNVNYGPSTDIGRAFGINNLIGKVEIPETPLKPLVITGSIKPKWDFGPHAHISDFSLSLGLGFDDGKAKIEATASYTLTTELPSSLLNANKLSTVHWTMSGALAVSPDESGIANLSLTGSGKMVGEWKTPFGINEITLNGMGLDLTINIEFKATPAGVVVVPSPAAGIRGDANIGRTGKINASIAGAIDIATPWASGLYANITNIGLGTILSEFHFSDIGQGITEEQLKAFDQIKINHGKISAFPTEVTIAGNSYPGGMGLSGSADIFGAGGSIDLLLDALGTRGAISINPINWSPGGKEVFSISGAKVNEPMKGFLNINFNALGPQLTSAFAGTPFLALDARVGLFGSSSQTKLLLNPFSGSYFATNTKILNALDVLVEGECKSLVDFGEMKIRGAFNKKPIGEFTQEIYDYFATNVLGQIPYENIAILNNEIQALVAKKQGVVNTVTAERNSNIEQFNKAKNELENHVIFIQDIERRARESWAKHESIHWTDAGQRLYYWRKTNDLNAEIAANYLALETKRAVFDALIWISGLPPVELDPRISSIDADINSKVLQRDLLQSFKNLDAASRAVMLKLQKHVINGVLAKIIDIKKIEFEGKLGLFTDNYFGSDLLMDFLGNEIAIKSNIGINQNGILDLGFVFNSLQNPSQAQNISWVNKPAIGTKHNYQNVKTIDPLDLVNNNIELLNATINIPTSNAGDVTRLNGYAKEIKSMGDTHEATGQFGNGWKELTIEAWIKNNGSNGGFQTILSGNEGFVHFQIHPNGGNNVIYLDDGLAILLPILPDVNTEWRHVVLVAKSGDSRIYQNGALVGSANGLSFGNANVAPTGGITIGGNKVHKRPLIGHIADVRVWNVARTQDQIINGMHNAPSSETNGLVGVYFTNSNTDVVPSNIENYSQQFNTDTDISIPGSITNGLNEMTIEAWINNSSVQNDIQAIVSPSDLSFAHFQMSNATHVNNAVYTDNNGSISLPRIPKLTPGWHHIALSTKSGSSMIVIDGSQIGETNTGTYNTIKPSQNIGIGKGYSNGRKFNGKIANVRIWNKAKTVAEIRQEMGNLVLNNNSQLIYHSPINSMVQINSSQQCVKIPNSATTDIQNIIIEAWVNNSTVQNDIQAIVSAAGPEFVHFQMSGSATVNNAVYLNDGRSISLPCIPKLNEGWHHVAMIVESGNSRILVDGEQVGSKNSTIFTGLKDSNSVNIGKGWQGGRVFNGKIADVRIWKNRILTNQQINQYSFTPPPVTAAGLAYHLR